MKHLNVICGAVFHLIAEALVWCVKTYIDAQVRFDRKVLKRYLGIETPLYRLWHERHAVKMQRKLNYESKMRAGYTLCRVF